MKVERLTVEQEAQLAVYRERWLQIGLSTGPCVRGDVERAVDEVYRCAGREAPKVKIWLTSPHAGAIAATMLDQVWDQVGNQVRDQVGDQVRDQVGDQVRDQVYRCGYGTQDANWLGFYEFFARECGLAQEVEKLAGMIHLAEAGCGWWWPFEQAVILTERPVLLRRDEEHRLHCEEGPALAYADGFAVYAWHGVRVRADIIEHPEQIRPEQVLQEENQEVRRVILERYGWPQLLRDVQATEVHRDRFGVLYETARLGEYLDGEDPVARFVHVQDPSTAREYALRVPPATRTAQEGIGWTFGLEGEVAARYAPGQEA